MMPTFASPRRDPAKGQWNVCEVKSNATRSNGTENRLGSVHRRPPVRGDTRRLLSSAPGFLPAPTFPAVNLWLSEDSVVVTAEIPGLSKDDLELTVQDDTLTIRGTRTAPEAHDGAWHRRERPTGSFARTIDLPFRVDADTVDARMQDGVLAVEMKRPETDKPRRIEITSG